jgi:hypothetical protein
MVEYPGEFWFLNSAVKAAFDRTVKELAEEIREAGGTEEHFVSGIHFLMEAASARCPDALGVVPPIEERH